MRILIISQEEPFYLPLGMAKLVKEKKQEIIGATVLKRKKPIKKLFLLYGFKSFAVQSSQFVLFKFLDILAPMIKPKRFYSVKRIFRSFSIPLIPIKNINSQKYLEKIKPLQPDIIISFACPQIFKKELLNLPPLGCINVHGSLLPRYRGKNIGFWLLKNREKETGVSVHYMNEKIDAGDIILQEKIKIDPQETVHSLYKKILPKQGRALTKTLDMIKKGKVKTKKISGQLKKEDYFSEPKKEDIKTFRKLGKRFR